MKGRFIEGPGLTLGVMLEPETDDERLLLRAFAAEVEPTKLLEVNGWGDGGDAPGLRFIKLWPVPMCPKVSP